MTALKLREAELPIRRYSMPRQQEHVASGTNGKNGNGFYRFSVPQSHEWPSRIESGPWAKADPGPLYYVFDFDGVISSEIEEQIYRLPVHKDEQQLLEKIATYFHISFQGYDTRYLRHLIVQELLLVRHIPIEPGPFAKAATELSSAGLTFFLLTARSGRAAVKRALSFLDCHKIRPQELFFVGRAAKGRQLSLIRGSIGPGSLIYFDDSPRHTKNSKRLAVRDFKTVVVEWPKKQTQAAAIELYDDCISWFRNSVNGSLGELHGNAKRGRSKGR